MYINKQHTLTSQIELLEFLSMLLDKIMIQDDMNKKRDVNTTCNTQVFELLRTNVSQTMQDKGD